MSRMVNWCRLAASTTAFVLFTLSMPTSAAEIKKPGPALSPASRVPPKAGAQWIGRLNGDRRSMTLESVQGDRLFFKDDWGCTWERPNTPGFTADRWSGCRSDDGALNVELEGDVVGSQKDGTPRFSEPFPLGSPQCA